METREIENLLNNVRIENNNEFSIGKTSYDFFTSIKHTFVIESDYKKTYVTYSSKREAVDDIHALFHKPVIFLNDLSDEDYKRHKKFEEDYEDREEPEHNPDHREGWDYAVKEMEDRGDREWNEEMFHGGE